MLASLLIRVSLLLVFFSAPSAARTYSRHKETYQISISRRYVSCYYSRCGWHCSGWWWWYGYWGCGYSGTCRYCNAYYRTDYESRERCQTNWAGPNCDIPICNPPCTLGKTCTEGNKCECLTSGQETCRAVACSSKSCYPGTCKDHANDICECPPQFSGDNCQKFNQKPEITDCQVKLFSGSPEVEVAQADCAVEGVTPELTWVRNTTFSRIVARWEAKYTDRFQPVLPTSTVHIEDAKFGVTESKAVATVNRTDNTGGQSAQQFVECSPGLTNPQEIQQCRGSEIQWREFGIRNLLSNETLQVSISAKLGGFKKPRQKANELISSEFEQARLVRFIVDAKAPWHCRQDALDACFDPTISLKQDTVQNALIEGEFTGWNDSESGIEKYDIQIYPLLKLQSEKLLETPKIAEESLNVPAGKKFQYTLRSPGVYSIEVTVTDKANNPSRARKIILFDNENHMTTTKEPLIVEEASKESEYRWITKTLPEENDGLSRLRLSWKGRYINNKHVTEGWLYRVRPWDSWYGIDDNQRENSGNRTIHEVKHTNGTVGYKLGFKVDKHGGRSLEPKGFASTNTSCQDELNETIWCYLESDNFKKTLVMPHLTPNDTIVIWMLAYDRVGFYFEDRIKIGFDTSPPLLDDKDTAVLKENFHDPYKSRIEIKARDYDSGIREVQYTIVDSTLNQNITTGSVNAEKMSPSGFKRKRSLAVCTEDRKKKKVPTATLR